MATQDEAATGGRMGRSSSEAAFRFGFSRDAIAGARAAARFSAMRILKASMRGVHDRPGDVVAWFIAGTSACLAIFFGWRAVMALWRDAGLGDQKSVEAARQLLVAVGALAAVPFVVWRIRTAQQQADTAFKSHVSTLFAKAIDQLGAVRGELTVRTMELRSDGAASSTSERTSKMLLPAHELRVGAVHALARIAEDSPRDARSVLDALASYVRRRSEERDTADVRQGEGEPDDVQIAMRAAFAIQSRLSSVLPVVVLDLGGLRHLGRRLAGIHVMHANANGAAFNRVGLDQVVFAHTTLRGATFEGAWTIQSRLGADPALAPKSALVLEDVDAAKANFKNATLRAVRAARTSFTDATLAFADFSGLVATEGCSFGNASLLCARLSGADFGDSDLTGASLEDARLDGANLEHVRSPLPAEQLALAWGDHKTKLPANAERPKNERWLETEEDRQGWEDRWRTARAEWFGLEEPPARDVSE